MNTRSDTRPGPSPVVDDVTVIHAARLAAVHVQPVIVETATSSAPPLAVTEARPRSMVNRHGAPSCAIVTPASFTFSSARRAAGVVFDEIVKATVALPCPVCDDAMAIQGFPFVTDHVQSRSVVMAIVPEPPEAGNADADAEADTAHFAAVGAATEAVDCVHAADPQAAIVNAIPMR